MKIIKIVVKNYRSINNLSSNFIEGKPTIVCGSNNVGKTNFLRALDLFFSLDIDRFNPKEDIPYDIEEGTFGGGRKIRFEAFFEENNDKIKIIVEYKISKDKGKFIEIKAKKNSSEIKEAKAREIVGKFKYLFIEASNINMPKLIADIVDNEILVSLDKQRSRQTKPLEDLHKFIKKSKNSVSEIEKNIGKHLNDFVLDVEGIDTKDWKIEILFPEFNKLRFAISDLIDFTLFDKNKRKISTKGSGIQRIIYLSLIKYIVDNSKKNVIIAIDEPEAFLQPALQKRASEVIKKIAKKAQVILTTHSSHIIDLNDLSQTFLFRMEYEKRPIARKKNEEFYKVKTIKDNNVGIEKVQLIKKYLGLKRNDSWEIMPYNLLVEGDEDRDYLNVLFESCKLENVNILVASGTSKIRGYLSFLEEFCEDLDYKPKVICILDHDSAGKAEFSSLKNKNNYKKFDLVPFLINRADGEKDYKNDYEIEDFIFPEVIKMAVNKLLRKKQYKGIKKRDFQKRFDKGYDKSCILKFITEHVKSINSSLANIDFESESIKKIICRYSCEIIKSKEMDDNFKSYPEVKKYLEKILNSNNL